MADHRITDFVDQSAIDGLIRLKGEMTTVKETYIFVANELNKGLKIPIDGIDQLEMVIRKVTDLQAQAAAASQRHAAAIEEQNRIAANTTNTISRQLMEQEKLNEKTRDAYTRQREVKEILTQAVSSYDDMTKRLAAISIEQDKLNEKKKAEKKLYDEGKVSYDAYQTTLQRIIQQQQALAAEKSQLESYTKSEAKENNNAMSSYNAMSQELARLKKAYRELDEEGRNTEMGQNMLAEIKELGAHLKDMDASMGDFHRNVGDYAIACQNGVVVTESLNSVLGMEAATIQGCIEQNKELEAAKTKLNTADANYETTLARINAKIEENRRRISDVDAILNKEATSVAEAEAQNKQLAEALKLVDLKSEGAAKRIAEINNKIAENKRVIEQATPALREETKAIEEQRKASEGLVDQLGGLIGVNTRFGSSLHSLAGAAKGGKVIDGLTTKVKAFGSTLMGLLSNPWVLAILGIGGVVAGFKCWYEYNKGLVEATKLTKSFTGYTGDRMKNLRDEIDAVAEKWDKDFLQVLNATDKMASQLGISYEEALSAIKDGFLIGADEQGTFLQNVEKFAPALRDAGLSAKEMVAIINQTKSGVFSEDGIKAIQTATDRIRRMPKATAEAIDAIGLSSKTIQKELENGSKSMFDVVQEVSAKMKELPQNSEAYGEAIFNVFGRKAAAGGALLIENLSEINTDLDSQKEKMGELTILNEKELNSQIELKRTLASVFDKTGGSFEAMVLKGKIFINETLIGIIRKCVDLINWGIKMYNQYTYVRGALASIANGFKTMWEVAKFVIKQIANAMEALGEIIEGALALNPDTITAGWSRAMKILQTNFTAMVGNIKKNTEAAIEETMNGSIGEVNADRLAEGLTEGVGGGGTRGGGGGGSTGRGRGRGKGSNVKSDAEKAVREEIKRLNELDEAKLKAMDEGHEKEMEKIRVNYNKKIREITGNSENEIEARRKLTEAMEKELAECEKKYQDQRASINLANRLAAVKKGSEEEMLLKMQQLNAEEDKELEAAEKTGADTLLIETKYGVKRRELREEYGEAVIKKIQEQYAAEAVVEDNELNKRLEDLRAAYADELKLVGNNEEKRAALTAKYENWAAEITEQYAIRKARAAVKMYEEMLQEGNLSEEERNRLERELAAARIDLEKAVTDAVIAETERRNKADKKAMEKRIERAQRWLNVAADALNNINALSSAISDARIERIDEELEASKEAADKEQQHITELVEKKVITQEEGEARKRAAEAQSAKKTEELEAKKQKLKHRQAVWDKANSIAQAAIATALAITQALPNLVLAAIAGAMGAIQIATIAATPIPKYAKGTDYHQGGLAVVGDGGRAEVVSFGGQMYLTPDKPTLIDMPKGAEVFPDAEKLIGTLDLSATAKAADSPKVVVNNDYTALQREVANIGSLIRRNAKEQRRAAYLSDLDRLKIMKGL